MSKRKGFHGLIGVLSGYAFWPYQREQRIGATNSGIRIDEVLFDPGAAAINGSS